MVFALVDNGDDLVVLLQVVRADGLVDRGAAVQLVDDELPQRFFLFGDDADAALLVVVKNEMIQNDAVEIRAENTQNDGCLLYTSPSPRD